MLFILRSKLLCLIAIAALASAPLGASGVTRAHAGEKVVYAFRGGKKDGRVPGGGLVADSAGNLYGATEGGGTGANCYGHPGCGTLFKIAKNGTETVLYSFQGGNDGIGPLGPLLLDSSGNLYGITGGGGGAGCGGYGCGTVFKYTPDGMETVLYAFQGGTDGQYPQGSLIADGSGNLYGITFEGGNYNGSECAQDGCGTVFEVQPDGTKTTLYSFQDGSDGAYPNTGLVADSSGNFYGVTGSGGDTACNPAGCGTVFKLSPDGTETVFYAFQGNGDGEFPLGGVMIDAAGNLYGTTSFGGMGCGCGTVFEVSPGGAETVLYSFKAGSDGETPEAGLVMDQTGNLYGTTPEGGGNGCRKVGCGVVFELAPNGNETILQSFREPSGGLRPAAALLLGKHGDLYGTTPQGGLRGNGVVFELKK